MEKHERFIVSDLDAKWDRSILLWFIPVEIEWRKLAKWIPTTGPVVLNDLAHEKRRTSFKVWSEKTQAGEVHCRK